MMAAEYLSIRPLRPFFETIGVIPVARGTRDTSSTRAALRALANGEIIGVFPEGRIARTREMLPFHPGAAVLAGRSGAPVVPAALEGTMRGRDVLAGFVSPSSARLCFGEPFTVTSSSEPEGVGVRTDAERIERSVRFLYASWIGGETEDRKFK
jgi:1-acyl-sn-glycerol-3-phosphate acyltransferase